MLPTSAGVEPATSWSPVGRRIQLSHRGRLFINKSIHARNCGLTCTDKFLLQQKKSINFTFPFNSVAYLIWDRSFFCNRKKVCSFHFFFYLFVLKFYGPVNPLEFSSYKLPFLNQRKGENDRRKYFTINLHERMLPTSVGVEPTTSWSPVGRRIQLSHQGQLFSFSYVAYLIGRDQFLLQQK